MNRSNHISHHGVPGMKWGKIKAKQVSDFVSKKVGEIKIKDAANRARMLELAKSRDSVGTTDRMRFHNASKPLGVRALMSLKSEARVAVVNTVISTLIYGKTPSAKDISKKLLLNSAKKVALDSALAKVASKKYDSNGKLLPRFKNQKKSIMTREDAMDLSFRVADKAITHFSPFFKTAIAKKVKNWSQEKQAIREARESVFTKAVLERRVPVWNSEDGSVSVFDP